MPKKRRRWFRYSLRTLWVFITLLAIALAWVAHERSQSQLEHQVAEQLIAGGATVGFAGLFDDRNPNEQSWWHTSLRALLGTRVRRIHGLKNTFTDVSPLAALHHLQELHLTDTQVTDLSPLAGLKQLKWLYLDNTQVCDLAPLVGSKNLQILDLYQTHVSDLSPLAGLKNLQELDLTLTQVSDLSPLTELTKLELLLLSGTQVSDEQVNLRQQALPNCKITR